MWWLGLDQEIEEMVKSCVSCQAVKNAPAVAPLHPWLWPPKPWQRLHVDFAGPFRGRIFLNVVDAHCQRLLKNLKKRFSTLGYPNNWLLIMDLNL